MTTMAELCSRSVVLALKVQSTNVSVVCLSISLSVCARHPEWRMNDRLMDRKGLVGAKVHRYCIILPSFMRTCGSRLEGREMIGLWGTRRLMCFYVATASLNERRRTFSMLPVRGLAVEIVLCLKQTKPTNAMGTRHLKLPKSEQPPDWLWTKKAETFAKQRDRIFSGCLVLLQTTSLPIGVTILS